VTELTPAARRALELARDLAAVDDLTSLLDALVTRARARGAAPPAALLDDLYDLLADLRDALTEET